MLGDGLAGGAVDLQGADNALVVVGVEPLGRLRVHLGERFQHGLPALFLQFPLQLTPQGAVG